MKKKLLFIAFPLFLCLYFTACNTVEEVQEADPVLVTVSDYVYYDILLADKEYTLSLYEPEKGAYLGAYVLANKTIGFDMNNFEEVTGKKHATYTYNLRLGEGFPKEWILQCIAKMKTPHIIIYPPNDYRPFDAAILEELAAQLSEFYVPMFVELYPNPLQYNMSVEDYIGFYQQAYTVFEQKASNVALVWSVDNRNLSEGLQYYPGDAYVHWVGINFYCPLYEAEGPYNRNLDADLSYFYYEFQKRKPIMISQLAISHYSTYDHVYQVQEASAKILDFYRNIQNQYPRIKMVNYMDFNNIDILPVGSIRDNFSITENAQVCESYQKAVQENYFLEEVSIYESGSLYTEYFKSPFSMVQMDGKIYLPEYFIRLELFREDAILNQEDFIRIDDTNYYPAELLPDLAYSLKEAEKIIVIQI